MKILSFPWKEMLLPSKSDNMMAISLMISSICLTKHYIDINAERISDCITFYLHKIIPIKIQNLFRDSGSMNVICDYGAYLIAALTAKSDLQAGLDFYNISKQLHIFQYGATNEHILEVFQPLDSSIYHKKDNNNNQSYTSTTAINTDKAQYDTLVFVHGGAWGCGRPWHYRLAANGLGLLLNVKTVILIGYPTYPASTILMQKDYVTQAMHYINTNNNIKTLLKDQHFNKNQSIILAGHSSGANICALSLLDNINHDNYTDTIQKTIKTSLNIKTFIGLCGVYDIGKHYLFETNRGVHIISPMCSAAGGRKLFQFCSPTSIVKNISRKYASIQQQKDEDSSTSGKRESSVVAAAPSSSVVGILGMPDIVLIHGSNDMVVPYSSSEELASSLRELNLSVELIPIPLDHMEPLYEARKGLYTPYSYIATALRESLLL